MAVKEKTRRWTVFLLIINMFAAAAVYTIYGYWSALPPKKERLLSEVAAEQASDVHGLAEKKRIAEEEARLEKENIITRGITRQNKAASRARLAKYGEILRLVNPWNYMPENYVPTLRYTVDGQRVDARCADELDEMMNDCFAAGGIPTICSAYRTWEMQEYLYQNKIERVMYSGVSYEEAPKVAAMTVAVPGTSEHQLGLALDIVDENYPNLDEWQENTYTQRWLMENSWKYGFILRYPNGTSDITGIIYEPWHYRYVGKAAAKEIYELGITLEEYIQLLQA